MGDSAVHVNERFIPIKRRLIRLDRSLTRLPGDDLYLLLRRLTGTLDTARVASTWLDMNSLQEKESPNAKRVEMADCQPKPQHNLGSVNFVAQQL